MAGNESYLKPRVGKPQLLRKKRNGQFDNPPLYMELGGMSNSRKLNRDTDVSLKLEKGGPKVRKGKII